LDDRTLVQRLIQGDPEAQEYLDRTYRLKLYRSCCHLLGYRDSDAEDVVQDTFLAALQQIKDFQFRSSLYRWLYQIAMYKCFRVIRKRRRQVATLSEDMEVIAAGEAMERVEKEKEENRLKELAEVIRSERDALGDPCKTLLKKRDEEGQTYGQLAETLKIPVGTVMSRLSRCMESLRKRLERRRKGEAQ
jgi:RNA polymerase sigma-70 factor (ECF subfamily)